MPLRRRSVVPRRLLVLCWHDVDGTPSMPVAEGAGTRGLERQLRLLARLGKVVPLDEGLAALRGDRRPPPHAIALTFDDGYRDNLQCAVPILERLGLPATFFLVPGLLSGSVRPWWEHLAWAFARRTVDRAEWRGRPLALDTRPTWKAAYETVAEGLKQCPSEERDRAVARLVATLEPSGSPPWERLFLDWDGARDLVRRGFGIGSHTARHPILSQEPAWRQLEELRLSRERLEAELSVRVDAVAYPNGRAQDYDHRTVAAAAETGYRHGLTTIEAWNGPRTPPYEVRRFVLRPEDGAAGLRPLLRRLRAVARARS